MRGLDIRTQYALAHVMKRVDPDAAVDDLYEAECTAFSMGLNDYESGIGTPPQMFSGTPLVDRWEEGYAEGADLEDMADCAGCQSGDPCSVHDL